MIGADFSPTVTTTTITATDNIEGLVLTFTQAADSIHASQPYTSGKLHVTK